MNEHARFRIYLRTLGDPVEEYTGFIARELLDKLSVKPVHVSPIFDYSGKAIYPKVLVKCSFCKDEKPRAKRSVNLPPKAYFDFSIRREDLPHLTEGEFEVSAGERSVTLTVEGLEELNVDVGYGSKLIIKFNGPTLLKNPVEGVPFSSRFLPLPSFIFMSSVKDPLQLKKLDEVLVEDHSILHSAGKVWFLYKGKWLPGLSGVALYHVVGELDDLIDVLQDAALNGVGHERDKGFGDVKLELF